MAQRRIEQQRNDVEREDRADRIGDLLILGPHQRPQRKDRRPAADRGTRADEQLNDAGAAETRAPARVLGPSP